MNGKKAQIDNPTNWTFETNPTFFSKYNVGDSFSHEDILPSIVLFDIKFALINTTLKLNGKIVKKEEIDNKSLITIESDNVTTYKRNISK